MAEPVPAPVTLPVVAAFRMVLVTVAGVADGLPCRYSAATPATCGEAMEVPLMVLVFVEAMWGCTQHSPPPPPPPPPPPDVPIHAEVMFWPGANRSRQPPQLEVEARASVDVVAPTVIAFGARAGE